MNRSANFRLRRALGMFAGVRHAVCHRRKADSGASHGHWVVLEVRNCPEQTVGSIGSQPSAANAEVFGSSRFAE